MLTVTRPMNIPKAKATNYKEVKIPLYMGWLYISVGNISEIKKEFKLIEPEEDNEGIGGICRKLDVNNWLIGISSEYKKDWGIAAHEAAHFIHSLFESRGVVYSLQNDEHYCYLLTFVMREIQSYING